MGEQYRFTAVITGDLSTGKAEITGAKVNEAGEVIKELSSKTNTYANVLEAAHEAGYFLIGFALGAGRAQALANGDILGAIGLTNAAEQLGINLAPLDPERVAKDIFASIEKQIADEKAAEVTGDFAATTTPETN